MPLKMLAGILEPVIALARQYWTVIAILILVSYVMAYGTAEALGIFHDKLVLLSMIYLIFNVILGIKLFSS